MNNHDLPRWATAFVMPILNLLSALLVAALVIYLLGESPVESMGILINSAVVNPEGLSYTLFYASTFIFTGLAVSIAMQAGLFNIGAEGQMYFAGLGLTLAMLTFDSSLPMWVLIPIGMLGAALFGALWAFLPGYLQAKRGSHVVVTTIMFNYIAGALMNTVIVKYLVPAGEQNPASRAFSAAAEMPRLNQWFPVLGETPLNISFFLAIIALVIYGVMVSRSSWGFKLRATGLNKHAAHYAGVRISKMIITVMLISGALAGLGSVNSIMGSTHYLSLNFVGGAGFVGIAIALMGRQHPVGIFLSAVLFGALIQGGFDLSLEKQNIPPETFIFIQGLIILFCGAMENFYAPAIAALIKRKK
ncbi:MULTISPECIES: ABC transporter permease [unclassified Duganella]|uniref:ABC transporter permease n=1 Tax=unclassified Duganella TaxID=2636909 RepID=UPI0008748D9D|nr:MULTISPECIES: ABC transporter permease [unclassified Duganella]OEZ62489.1 branched-chain amino acid transport system / permease component [Duganella sp. HH105]OFA06195.1 branched-chain amino acid transport system / permease component [Duganella sp. HH101]